MSFVYYILDEKSEAIKIGKANNIEDRLSTLQTGNANSLELIGYVKCKSEDDSLLQESILHKKFNHLHIRGEWFKLHDDILTSIHGDKNFFKVKERRKPLVINTLFGEKEMFGIENSPSCYFYPNLTAHIKDNFEKSLRFAIPFRTMEYPTNGKSMLLPFSDEKNRVFISTKKHQENMLLNNYLKKKKQNDLLHISNQKSLEQFLE